MQHRTHPFVAPWLLALAGLAAAALTAATVSGQYSMTVSQDRLRNAQNESQNWLMMNGDYGSTRYSKLSQINRGNVKDLRLVWAMALGGMQDVGQNGPESELNPLVDNGFLYTSDGWGTIYKIDGRSPNKGEFVWVTDPGVKHEGNVPRSRGIALWEELVIANLPDGRVIAVNRNNGEIVWDKMVAAANEFGAKERFYTAPIAADGKVIVANGAGDAKTRGWIAALDARTGKELWRWYVVPKPGDPGSETWKDTNNAWKTGGGGLWQTGSYDPATKLTIWGTGNPVPHLRSAGASGRQPLHQLGGGAERRHRQAGLVFPVHAERFLGLRRGRHAHAVRHDDQRPQPQGRQPFRAQRVSSTRWIAATANSSMGGQVRQRSELDQRAQSEDRQAARLRSETRCADLQSCGAGAARRPQQAHLPHLARRHRAPADRLQPREEHRLRRGHRGLLLAETARRSRSCRRRAASTRRRARSAPTAATSTTDRSPPSTPSTTKSSPRR